MMREQQLNYTSLIWYEGDNLPKVEDQIFVDMAKTTGLSLTNSTASLWMFDYHSTVDFDLPTISGTATITSASIGKLEYQFTAAQTTTLAAQTTSLYRAFWQIQYAVDKLRIRIPTPFRVLKLT